MLHDAGDPIGKRHARTPGRSFLEAELQMRVCIDESWQQGNITQVVRRLVGCFFVDGDNATASNRYHAAGNWRLIDRNDPTRAIRNGR